MTVVEEDSLLIFFGLLANLLNTCSSLLCPLSHGDIVGRTTGLAVGKAYESLDTLVSAHFWTLFDTLAGFLGEVGYLCTDSRGR
eukprot:6462746-Amphidinium_carterae.1